MVGVVRKESWCVCTIQLFNTILYISHKSTLGKKNPFFATCIDFKQFFPRAGILIEQELKFFYLLEELIAASEYSYIKYLM